MKLGFAALLLLAASAFAHPGVGIVVDSRGNVFYTDLHHVWRIAPGGQKAIAVPNVHTHELYVDSSDNLYGEHLWYNGERLDTWGSRVWRRSPDGRVVDIVPAHPGFNDSYSFVRDASGNMYWAAREKNEIQKRTPDGRIVTVARHHFRDVRWTTVTPAGKVYLIDTLDLLRVTAEGKVSVVARNLSRWKPARLVTGTRHALMGLWTDRSGNIYVADHSHDSVKRVTPAGRVSVVVRPSYPWSPTGGIFDRDGNLWLLEYSVTNAARARKITAPVRTLGPASTDR